MHLNILPHWEHHLPCLKQWFYLYSYNCRAGFHFNRKLWPAWPSLLCRWDYQTKPLALWCSLWFLYLWFLMMFFMANDAVLDSSDKRISLSLFRQCSNRVLIHQSISWHRLQGVHMCLCFLFLQKKRKSRLALTN